MQYWPLIVFGWPSVLVGLILQLAGIVRRNTLLAFSGAVISLGFCAYIVFSPPPFRWFGLVAMVGNFLSAVAVMKRRSGSAAIALVPFFVLVIYLALKVLAQ